MNKNIKYLLYFIIVIVFCINNSHSVEILSNEYTCISNFITKFNLLVNYPKDSKTGLYNLCGTNSKVTCFSNNGSVQYFQGVGTNEVIPQDVQVLISDLECLPSNTRITLTDGFKISQEFLKYKFNFVDTIELNNVIIDSLEFPLPSYSIYTISSPNLNGQTIKLSNLLSISKFSSSSKIQLDVDTIGIQNANLKALEMSLVNLPNFNGFTLDSLEVSFNSTFESAELENFKYIRSSYVFFNFYALKSVPFYLQDNTYISTFEHRGIFDKPSSKISLASNDNYKSITIKDTGLDFFINNEIPFEVSGQTNLYFQATTGLSAVVNTIPPSNYIGKYKTGQIRYSYLGGNLPTYNGSALAIDYSNNKITGTIDSSWCSTNLFVSSNQLTGTVPSCFSCYYKYTPNQNTYKTLSDPGTMITFSKMIDRFSNNNFTNLNESLACTTFRPQVSLVNSTTIAIKGQDIGFDISNFLINSTIACANTPDAIRKLSYEFYCNISPKNFLDQTYARVKFTLPTNAEYSFALVESNPIVTYVKRDMNDLLTITGSFFSSYKGQSDQRVYLGKNLMDVTTQSFTGIYIYINSTSYYTEDKPLIIVQNGDKITKVYAVVKSTSSIQNNFKCVNNCVGNPSGSVCDLQFGKCLNVTCPNDCSGNGLCNTDLYGICECFDGYLGEDCGLIQCADPTCSNGNGVCNTTIGECECNDGYLGDDCNLIQCVDPTCSNGNGVCNTVIGECECNEGFLGDNCNLIQCADPTCSNGNGICNTVIGECECSSIWAGSNCDIPAHYVTSIEPSTINGGNASFYGSFGTINQDLNVSIDNDKQCNVTFISPNKITCLAPLGRGIHNITINQNGISFIGINIYKYMDPSLTGDKSDSGSNNNGGNCIYNNNCDENGQENTNIEKPITQVKVDSNTTQVELDSGGANGDITKFKIHIKSLSEVNLSGQVIKYYPLNNSWSVNKTSTNVFTFNQVLANNSQECIISTQIEILNQDKQLSFAGVDFSLGKGSIKFTISIEKYNYQSFLNTLQLEFESSALENSPSNTDCNTNSSKINTDYYSDQNDLSIIKITQNNIDLNARFINKAISDSRSTYISSKIITGTDNSVSVVLNLPHFVEKLTIDPDFSVLLSSDFKSSCGSKSSKKYVIPLSVVLSCVGAAAIISTTYYFYKRNKDNVFRKKIIELTNKYNK